MGIVTSFLIVLGCLVLSAFFSAAETALMRLREHELAEDVEAQRGPGALAARELLASTSRLLVTILFGNNVANILGASVGSALALHFFGPDLAVFVSAGVMTVLVFIFGEVLPKAVAAHHPRGVASALALPLYLIHQAMRPLHILCDRILDPFVERIVGKSRPDAPSTTEEILRLAQKSQETAPQTGSLAAIIGAAAGAAQMTVSDIMVPRTEITAFPAETPAAEILEKVLEERYTRVPVYEDSIDQIIGLVHLKDLVKLVHDGGTDVRGILKNVLRVPERNPILPLLADMQHAFVHMAIVKDEFNVTQGIVTQEDILEELVGEIRDEFDREELLTIRRLGDDQFEALGRVKVLDFNRESGWDIPAERGDTLAGLIFNRLGRAPRRWETLHLPDYEITVVDVSGSRITQIRVRRLEEDGAERAEV